jgi:hypothetical protein
MRRIIAFAITSLLVGAFGMPPPTGAAARTADPASPATNGSALVDVHGVSDLRAAFNNDQGKVRLVLLVSPT